MFGTLVKFEVEEIVLLKASLHLKEHLLVMWAGNLGIFWFPCSHDSGNFRQETNYCQQTRKRVHKVEIWDWTSTTRIIFRKTFDQTEFTQSACVSDMVQAFTHWVWLLLKTTNNIFTKTLSIVWFWRLTITSFTKTLSILDTTSILWMGLVCFLAFPCSWPQSQFSSAAETCTQEWSWSVRDAVYTGTCMS